MKMHGNVWAIPLLVLGSLCWFEAAFAQDGAVGAIPVDPVAGEPPAESSTPSSSPIAQIVVTAQRREEALINVPISISVLDQQQISNANITNASDLALYTPSLKANTLFGAENASFAIRGFVQDVRTTSSVATYFAEVVAPRGQTLYTSGDGAGPGELFDLMNVQVLKGPQGTLFGRNSTGGAVLIVPQKPTNDLEGHLEISAGDFGMWRQEGVFNLPVTDRFKLRFGVDHQKRDGYLTNVADYGDHKLADVNYTALRMSALWDLSDSVQNYTIGTFTRSHTQNYAPKLFACNRDYLQAILDGTLEGLPGLPPFAEANPLLVFIVPACQRQLDDQAARGENGFYDVADPVRNPRSLIEQHRLINTTTWSVNDQLSIKATLAYALLYTKGEQTTFGSDFRVAYDLNPAHRFEVATATVSPDFATTNQESRVGELQAQGTSLEDRLEWQGGLYYERSLPHGVTGFRAPSLISCDPTSFSGDIQEARCFDETAGQLGSILDLAAATEYNSRAVYGQSTYKIFEPLSVTLGLRYTDDKTKAEGKKVRYNFVGSIPQAPIETITNPRVQSDKVTGAVNLMYKPGDDATAYVKYSQGYRQGGINTQADPGLDTYDPESVKTYELGFKAQFGGWFPGRFSTAIFYNDFTNMQLKTAYVSQTSGTVPAIFNAGKSRIEGAEAEVTLLLRDDLTLDLSYSHLKSKLLSQEDHQAQVQAIAGAFAAATYTQTADVGDPLPYSPDHNAVATLTYIVPLAPDMGKVSASATYAYTSKQQVVARSASPYAILDSFSILNASLTWASVMGTGFDVALFGTNLLDEKYFTYVQGGYNALGFEAGSTGAPRMMGLRVKYHFGN